ncbi:MAG: AAA family ATPase [Candidatus Odinarchaeota archaeon]
MSHELFEAASKIAKEAVKLDKQNNPREAAEKYLKAADVLIKNICFKTAEQYIKRAKELRRTARGNFKEDTGSSADTGEVELAGNISDIILTEKPSVRWSDVADLKEAKQALREAVILPMLRPDLFTGARVPWRGILLFGPPGCGKCVCEDETVITETGERETAAEIFHKVKKRLLTGGGGEYVYTPEGGLNLLSVNISGKIVPDRVSFLYTKKDAKCLRLRLEYGGDIKIGENHPLLCAKEKGYTWVRGSMLQLGDRVAYIQNISKRRERCVNKWVKFPKIIDIEVFKQDIYDFETVRNHTYLIGEGFISHNTFISKAVANESNATFFSADAATLVSKWLGESEKAIKSLFNAARENAPSIIFIDEIDAIAGTRDEDEVGGERRLKTQMLIEMDGVKEYKSKQLMVLGATNRPWDIDPAFRRRFERRIYIPLPDKDARKEVFKYHLKGIDLDEDVDLDELAEKSEGFTSSDIALICRESAMTPIRELDEQGLLENVDCKPRPVNRSDLISSLTRIKPVVTPSEIKRYEEWASEYRS